MLTQLADWVVLRVNATLKRGGLTITLSSTLALSVSLTLALSPPLSLALLGLHRAEVTSHREAWMTIGVI